MKLILNPLSILFLMLGGFLLFVEVIHTQTHLNHEQDTHGYVRQFCRSKLEICQKIVGELE